MLTVQPLIRSAQHPSARYIADYFMTCEARHGDRPAKPIRLLDAIQNIAADRPGLVGRGPHSLMDRLLSRSGVRADHATIRKDADHFIGHAPFEEILPLIDAADTRCDDAFLSDVLVLAREQNRADVARALIPLGPSVGQVWLWLFSDPLILNHDECIQALIARFGSDGMNRGTPAPWEGCLRANVTTERLVESVLPMLHAAGADVMDARFEELEGETEQGVVALMHYRRKVQGDELRKVAEQAQGTREKPRPRKRL
ncbi:hypothetical protein SAMN05216466_106134 [Paraburkholderia phenazinium]|uniref:Uncharacterized protein n=1 Tax=Paraburkholderia phenazinium TaxID=60549 RepID=A0A1G7YEA2_9BURK|nr:hypothetical protein [Paraburkholderia phenazinium]SDG94270.1 hypothetical protein SAMN05216466_106134 [Paraburkholderia phenazinium]